MSADDEGGPYEVGFCRPPTHSRFKKGRSGNPNGRPRKTTAVKDGLRSLVEQKVTTSSGKRVTVREVILNQAIKDLSQGKIKQWPSVLTLMESLEPKEKFVATDRDLGRFARLVESIRGEASDLDKEDE